MSEEIIVQYDYEILPVFGPNESILPPNIKDLTPIAQGGFGKIYDVGNGILKVIELCKADNTKHCRTASRDSIMYMYKNYMGSNVDVILTPDYISEVIASKLVSDKIATKGIMNLQQMKGFYYDKKRKTMYMLMERYVPIKLYDSNVVPYVFMVLMAIWQMQGMMRMTHYDLHWGNIMLKPLSNTQQFQYIVSETLSLQFPTAFMPTVIDLGSAVFSYMSDNNQTRQDVVNTINPKMYRNFDPYFDQLTVLKSTLNEISISENIKTELISCFLKDPSQISSYYDNMNKVFYRPKTPIQNTENLYNISDTLTNFVNKFKNNYLKDVTLIGNNKPIEGVPQQNIYGISRLNPYIPLDPIFPVIPDPIIEQKHQYYLNYVPGNESQQIPVDIQIYRELDSPNIFSFSLFCASKYLEEVYSYVYDTNRAISVGHDKEGGFAFYRHYLQKQLNGMVSLIQNTNIQNPEAVRYDQWKDFGCLHLVDKYVLDMPMMTIHDGIVVPWSSETKQSIQNIDRDRVKRNAKSKGVPYTLRLLKWGTVREYILAFMDVSLSAENRRRYGLYSYQLPDKFIKTITGNIDGETKEIKNTTGMIGSIIRFLPMQDSRFDIIIFRDAHSTLPNRNYKYDRGWFNTWLTKTDKRFWVYHGPFYNPPHAAGLKTAFAATWGVRKVSNQSVIMTPEEYSEYFGYSEVEEDKFFEKTSYGIDERIFLRAIQTHPTMISQESYLVGMIHFLYLFIGQANPRRYQMFKDKNINDLPNIGELLTQDPMKDFNKDPSGTNPVMCRPFEMVMGDYSMFEDVRCTVKYSIEELARIQNKQTDQITFEEFYSIVDKSISNYKMGERSLENRLLHMIPPRWNVWSFLYMDADGTNGYLDPIPVVQYLKTMGGWAFPISWENACDINAKYYTGNAFNFDDYAKPRIPSEIPGQPDQPPPDLPPDISLPDGYPN